MNIFKKKDTGETTPEGVGKKLNRFLRKNAAGEKDLVETIRDRRKGLGNGRIFRSNSPEPGDENPSGGSDGKRSGSARSSVKERRERRVSWCFMLPSVAGVALFFLIPFFVVIYYSMIDNPVRHRFVWFSNYVKVFGNSAFRLASWNTLKFSVVAVPLAVSLSLLLAVVMEQKLPWKSRFRSFFLSPMMVPTASVIMIWQILFHYNGLVNSAFGGILGGKIDWLKSGYAQVPVILLFLWKNLGYNMILFMSGLANIPRDQIEVAKLEGATEVYLMGGDYPYDALYMLQHFMNNTFKSLDYQKLSAAAVMMAIFMILVIGALFLAENRFGKDLE